MTLPYVRRPKYISPSALWLYEKDPLAYYFQYLGPPELKPKRDPQTEPMAVGSAFDYMVKAYLAARLGQRFNLKIEESVEKQHLNASGPVMVLAAQLFQTYMLSPASEQILEAGLSSVETAYARDLEPVHIGYGEVPIHGKPDAAFNEDGIVRILDWKVTGALCKNPASPHAGYKHLWTEDNKDVGPHKRWAECLGSLNSYWATQLTIYGWLLGRLVGEPIHVAIDQIVVRGDKPPVIAQIRTTVTRDFTVSVMARIQDLWDKILAEEVVDEMSLELAKELL